ncbi:hypothetical protein JL722_5873 [Aureococcus anophagefferens]|nr:hypothetical protein JL722_5873 [Aureococcus anophagefferens]
MFASTAPLTPGMESSRAPGAGLELDAGDVDWSDFQARPSAAALWEHVEEKLAELAALTSAREAGALRRVLAAAPETALEAVEGALARARDLDALASFAVVEAPGVPPPPPADDASLRDAAWRGLAVVDAGRGEDSDGADWLEAALQSAQAEPEVVERETFVEVVREVPARPRVRRTATRVASNGPRAASRPRARQVDRVVEREKIVVRVVEGEAPGDESGEKARLLALVASRAGNENSGAAGRDAEVPRGRGDERELESLGAALARHPERRAALARERAAWDAAHAPAAPRRCAPAVRDAALGRVAGHEPARARARGPAAALAARVFERALWLARFPRRRVAKMALADLRRLNLHRLDLDELRGVYACLPPAFACDGDGAKAAWREAARERLVSLARRAADGRSRPAARHGAYGDLGGDGPFDPDEHDADDGIAAQSPGDARRGRDAELAALSECRRAAPSLSARPAGRRRSSTPRTRASPCSPRSAGPRRGPPEGAAAARARRATAARR